MADETRNPDRSNMETYGPARDVCLCHIIISNIFFLSLLCHSVLSMAFMRNDVTFSDFTIKPRFVVIF